MNHFRQLGLSLTSAALLATLAIAPAGAQSNPGTNTGGMEQGTTGTRSDMPGGQMNPGADSGRGMTSGQEATGNPGMTGGQMGRQDVAINGIADFMDAVVETSQFANDADGLTSAMRSAAQNNRLRLIDLNAIMPGDQSQLMREIVDSSEALSRNRDVLRRAITSANLDAVLTRQNLSVNNMVPVAVDLQRDVLPSDQGRADVFSRNRQSGNLDSGPVTLYYFSR